jgi:branched-chain amino acid transport system permease protein
VAVGRVRRVAYFLSALGTGAVDAVLFCHFLYVQPASIFGPQYSVSMLFMVLIGGLGTLERPLLGVLLFFTMQQFLGGTAPGTW